VLAAAGVAGVGLVLASRPLWLVDTREPYLPGMEQFVGALQAQQGLPVDGLRTYAEDSVTWLVWWLGPVTVVLALLAAVRLAAVGTRAVLSRGPLPVWLLPVVVGMAVTVVSLYRPAITPDHPWADRRYVTVTYPFVVLTATAALAWLAAGARASRPRRVLAGVLAVGALVPTVLATLPVATARTEVGQVEASEAVCDALAEAGPRPAVLSVGFRARVEWAPVVRARCGVPLVGIEPPPGSGTGGARPRWARPSPAPRPGHGPTGTTRSSWSPTWPAPGPSPTRPGRRSCRSSSLDTQEPERLLEERPLRTRDLPVAAWLAELP
jgi:hypothetical protein